MDKKDLLIAVLVVALGFSLSESLPAIKEWGQKVDSTQIDSSNLRMNSEIILNKSSKEYAVMGREVWSAFSCGAWASINNQTDDQERLFLFGYDSGTQFLDALRAEKIEQGDLNSEVPIGVNLVLQGPTSEFILGRIFDSAQTEALSDVYKTGESDNSEEMQKIIAGNKYRDGNCQLLGR